jgi:hypothetical protein
LGVGGVVAATGVVAAGVVALGGVVAVVDVVVVVVGVAVVVGSAMAGVVERSATVVRLVECSGGGVWTAARRVGAAAQPAAMIPTTPATSSARRRPLRPVVRATPSLLPHWHEAVARWVEGRRSGALTWESAVRSFNPRFPIPRAVRSSGV